MTTPGERLVQPLPKNDGSVPGHERGCKCKPCVGRRSRRMGKAKQGAARKVIEKVTGTQAHWRGNLANEEAWHHLPIRVEVKAGKIMANPIWTRYRLARQQSDAAHATGDPRPYMMIVMPTGMSDGLAVIRLSELQAVIEALT